MYNFELNHLNFQDARNRTVRMIEDICEDFGLGNSFGILSLAIGETVSLILSLNQKEELSLSFTLDNNRFSVQIFTSVDNRDLEQQLRKASKFDEEGVFYIISKLTDIIEFRSEGTEIYMEFDVNPQLITDEDDRVGEMKREELRKTEEYTVNKNRS